MSTEPINFLTLMNNAGKAFSSLDGMACCYQWQCFDQFQFLPGQDTGKSGCQGIRFPETLKNPADLFKNNLNNIRNNMMSNNNGGIVELLIPTFFRKKPLMRGQKLFGDVVLNWRTNYQIMPRFGRSFINDKCIF